MIKCVIWDLDNTLWYGILSENQGVELRSEICEIIKSFNKKGVINSISSKNDFEIAKNKLISLNLWEYFVLPQINWNAKSENVKKIITSLHFREQNVLFVDDNLFEIEEVKSRCSNIVTCEAVNIEFIQKIEEDCKYMDNVEANRRVEMYKLEERRINDEEKLLLSKTEFLVKCNIRLIIEKAKVDDIYRIGELIDRTNQINSTGIRYKQEAIIEMVSDGNYDVFMATVEDNYGSYGRSGLVIAKKVDDVYEISLLIVSCRLMGKGISQALLSYAFNIAKQNNHKKIRCLFRRNQFNRQMIILYTMNGLINKNANNETELYELNIEGNEMSIPVWINLD